MIKYVFLLLFSGPFTVRAQLSPAALLPIPEALKKNAHAVKREERIELDIISESKLQYKVHQVITILDEAGSDELVFVQYTDKFISLEEVKIEIFDATGKLLNYYGKKELLSHQAGEGLVPDGKIYYAKAFAQSYPVTLQLNYTLKFNGLCRYPDYEIQLPEQATEYAEFTVRVPSDLDIRFKLKNTTTLPAVTGEGRLKNYNWSFKNIPALLNEEGSINRESRFPKIILAPTRFELDGNAGDMGSWKNFGNWYGNLSKKTGKLSDERNFQLQEMVKYAGTEIEKIKIIYRYLQQNFRYVSIQLGIGGFKPFDADFVDKKKYGDCKALSNYTQACLAAIGIKSYQALINAGYNREAADPDFPNNNFNHVILCVPLTTDTVWLECTSSTNEFGVLGTFTENRNALLITEEGGILVPTPKSKAADNLFSCTSIVTINEDGTGDAIVQLKSTGEYKQEFLHYITNEKRDEQKRFLIDYLGFIDPGEFELKQNLNLSGNETAINMAFDKVPAFTSGNKFFLSPRIYKLWHITLPKAEGRTLDFYFECPFIKTDTTVFKLPENFSIEKLPENKTLESGSANFYCTYIFDEVNKTVTTTAKLVLNYHKIPAGKFEEVKTFFTNVLDEYREKIVIKKL